MSNYQTQTTPRQDRLIQRKENLLAKKRHQKSVIRFILIFAILPMLNLAALTFDNQLYGQVYEEMYEQYNLRTIEASDIIHDVHLVNVPANGALEAYSHGEMSVQDCDRLLNIINTTGIENATIGHLTMPDGNRMRVMVNAETLTSMLESARQQHLSYSGVVTFTADRMYSSPTGVIGAIHRFALLQRQFLITRLQFTSTYSLVMLYVIFAAISIGSALFFGHMRNNLNGEIKELEKFLFTEPQSQPQSSDVAYIAPITAIYQGR